MSPGRIFLLTVQRLCFWCFRVLYGFVVAVRRRVWLTRFYVGLVLSSIVIASLRGVRAGPFACCMLVRSRFTPLHIGAGDTAGETHREQFVKNLGEMFGDFNQSFHRKVTIDCENEQ